MARVIFMCGPAGSGKSTLARALESEGMARLSFDEEAWRRGVRSQPLADDIHDEIERHLLRRLRGLVATQADVVLDFSFWSRRMRERYRDILRPLGVEPETIYLATPRAVVLARIRARQDAVANDVRLTDDRAAAYFDGFEAPTADEGPLTVIRWPTSGAGDPACGPNGLPAIP